MVRKNRMVQRVAALEGAGGVDGFLAKPSLAAWFKIVNAGPPCEVPNTAAWREFIGHIRGLFSAVELEAADAVDGPWPA